MYSFGGTSDDFLGKFLSFLKNEKHTVICNPQFEWNE
jgi:hypothetical protein